MVCGNARKQEGRQNESLWSSSASGTAQSARMPSVPLSAARLFSRWTGRVVDALVAIFLWTDRPPGHLCKIRSIASPIARIAPRSFQMVSFGTIKENSDKGKHSPGVRPGHAVVIR